MSLIYCACGCEEQREEFDSRGSERKYIRGHKGRGEKRSSLIRQKISNTKKRNPMSLENRQKLANRNSQRYWSPEMKEKISKRCMGKFGKDAPCWKGGLTLLWDLIRGSQKYSNWRTQVFGRDNFTCQECGKRGSWLEAHHIKRFSNIIKDNNIKTLEEAYMCEELWDLNNGITLCKECHNKTKGMIKMITIKGD